MKFVAMRVHNGITLYGFSYSNNNDVYWSMRFYPETWRIPMRIFD